MTPDRSHLTPELRTDRNGKTSTRWIKPSSAEAMASLGVPAPVLREPTYTQKLTSSRISKINEFMGQARMRAVMERWVGSMNDSELSILDDTLEVCESRSLDRAVVREQEVIKGIFYSLARGSSEEDRVVLEMLAIRKAFCSEWSQREQPTLRNTELKSYVYGMRARGGFPLEGDYWVRGITATVRFAYELTARFPNADFLPTEKTNDYAGFSGMKTDYRKYKSPELANLIFNHPEDTGYLIELAAEHQTNDPHILRGLIENPEGAAPLSKGWL